MEPSEDSFNKALKAGNMCLNRFCIDETAAFELSGVHYLRKSSQNFNFLVGRDTAPERKEKGKEFSFLYLTVLYPDSFILI